LNKVSDMTTFVPIVSSEVSNDDVTMQHTYVLVLEEAQHLQLSEHAFGRNQRLEDVR
jgi:hypothetical protein